MKPLVLFVDDEPQLLSALSRVLRAEPFEIARATSGEEALAIVSKRHVDAIVSDCDMPGMRGNELLARVRQIAPTCVRMMLTGKPTLDTVIDCVNRGEIQRFFVKPCVPADLAAALRHALREKALIEQARRLLVEFKRKEAQLAELETRHPGVTSVRTDAEGCIVLDAAPEDLDALLAEMQSTLALVEVGARKRAG